MNAGRTMIRIHFTRTLLRDAYDDLTERARLDLDFLLMTVVAAGICALGFKMNSASVIVGAMVISPLLYPVICIGAATYQRDMTSFRRATGTFAIGVIAAVGTAIAINLLFVTTFQSEITERLAAARIDYFFVALFSGLAGTYAFFSPKIHEAIAGIAISVALVPPVVMLGIAIAEQRADLFLASGTIVLCNVFGIYIGSFMLLAGLHWISGR
jgi:uncharacterized hydrophobic protein (TIGR00271 family)